MLLGFTIRKTHISIGRIPVKETMETDNVFFVWIISHPSNCLSMNRVKSIESRKWGKGLRNENQRWRSSKTMRAAVEIKRGARWNLLLSTNKYHTKGLTDKKVCLHWGQIWASLFRSWPHRWHLVGVCGW